MTPPPDLRPYLDELERFADGEMSAAEQEAFETRLENEPDLAEAHAAFEQLTADLRWAAGHNILSQRLRALNERMDQRSDALLRIQRRTRQRQRRLATLLGAGLLVLVLAGLGAWWFTRPAVNPSDNWESYYQPDPGPQVTAAMQHSNPFLSDALSQYQAGHYPAALHSLGRISPAKVAPDSLSYFRGIFLLRQGEGNAAQAYLRRLSEESQGELGRRARYHLGMAYWQAQERAEALSTLRAVAADSLNPYRASARQAVAAGVLTE
ncbi:hypothetical protein GCM10023185_22420 [Hymenobacter saemangeumensis]|uniref:Tetratricopeptide repeat protein n=1 Tax=Hymenobacter saemangeumensis TaxID=1084522 RepID=A0ABP8IF30_9BACT